MVTTTAFFLLDGVFWTCYQRDVAKGGQVTTLFLCLVPRMTVWFTPFNSTSAAKALSPGRSVTRGCSQ
jgi:hypothetical protein